MNKGGSCGDSCVYTNNTILSTLISNSTFGLGSGKIGIFYNYCAATVGSYCYGNSASTGIGVDNATSDVCPANWKLTSLEDFSTLCSILNNNTCSNDTVMDANDSNFIQYKLSTPLSGDRNGLGVYQQGVYAAFWTSTIDTYKNMRQVRFYQNKVNVTTANYRGMGQSVRCLLQE